MKNFLLRIVIALIALPLIGLILFVINWQHHLAFNILVCTVTLLATLEVERMFQKKRIPVWSVFPAVAGTTLPVFTYLEISGIIPEGYFPLWILSLLSLVFLRSLFVKTDDEIAERLSFMSSSIFIILYPGLFLSYIARMTGLSHPQFAILFFLGSVFLNDIMAYIFGSLFGKHTQLKLVISPNKTLVGFIAGFLTSIGVIVLLSFLLADYFSVSLLQAILLGSIMGISTIAGDLLESILKRSAEVKDSGVIMAGRGGLMDTIDSLLLSAPLFFFLFPLFSQPV